ncbi:replication protein C, IncQ-type, partial [Escherichia coli]
LQTDPARLMHQRLCGWIDPGKSGRVELDTLCGYVWPGQATNPNTLKTRRQAARRALPELAALGWTVSEYAKNKFEIGRPKATHLLGPAPKTQEISHTA